MGNLAGVVRVEVSRARFGPHVAGLWLQSDHCVDLLWRGASSLLTGLRPLPLTLSV